MTGLDTLGPDVTLTLDLDGVIQSATSANTISDEVVKAWVGRPWVETVADSGVERLRRTLDDVRAGGVSAYREILQRFPSGREIPIEYTTVRIGGRDGFIAVGRCLNASTELQLRLFAAQEAMERDYWKLRDVETRYRLLFDISNEAVLVLTAEDLRVADANPAAIRTLGLTKGWDFLSELSPGERDSFRAVLARVSESGRAPGGVFHLGSARAPWILRASLMSGDQTSAYMVQLVPVSDSRPDADIPEPIQLTDLVRRMPDGFVVTDRDGYVQLANQAFLNLVQAPSESAVLGHPLSRWLRQPEVRIDAVLAKLRQPREARVLSTTLEDELGASVDVEVSFGCDSESNPAFLGIGLRDERARAGIRGAGPAPLALASYDGRTPLKELVKSAVEVMERHYLESALKTAKGNRSAAAELLGLSRQSLYAKLNRYKIDGGSNEA